MNDLHLGPMLVFYQAVKLAPAVGADRHDKGTAPDLLCQANGLHIVVFLRPVDGEAPPWPAQRMHQHRDLGRVGAEVRMQMLDARCAQPRLDVTGLGQVNEVHGQRTVPAMTHAQRQRQCLQQSHRPGQQHPRQGNQKRWCAFAKDVARAVTLELVFRVQ